MTNYTLLYKNLWKQLLPPVLRKPKQLSWGTVLLQPIQSLHDFIFGPYSNGAVYPVYNNAVVYIPGDIVIYKDRSVYKNIQIIGAVPPPNATYWKLIQENYIGINERIKYNSRTILFEYALNKWFVCSGIFITNNDKDTTSFLMANSGELSSVMPTNSAFQIDYLSNAIIPTSAFSFTINVPVAVYNALSPIPSQRELIIRSFADKLVLGGIRYNVVTY